MGKVLIWFVIIISTVVLYCLMKVKAESDELHTEQNKTFLEQVPHREFQDLSIVYKVIISADKDAVQSSKITNEFAKRLGMSEEQLFKCAAENTRRLFPPVVRSMNDIMKEMFARDGMPQEIAEMMIAEIPPEQTMWVISNEKGINGAASMLYENELHELAESLESVLAFRFCRI